MPPSSDPRYWREKALRFYTDAAAATDPLLAARLIESASGCERTAAGLEEAEAETASARQPKRHRRAAA